MLKSKSKEPQSGNFEEYVIFLDFNAFTGSEFILEHTTLRIKCSR